MRHRSPLSVVSANRPGWRWLLALCLGVTSAAACGQSGADAAAGSGGPYAGSGTSASSSATAVAAAPAPGGATANAGRGPVAVMSGSAGTTGTPTTVGVRAGAGALQAAAGLSGGAAGRLGAAGTTAGNAAAAGRSSAAGSGGSTGAAGSGATGPAATKKFVGNITTSGQVRSDFAMYWDQITPENEGKWGSVEATRNQMNWAGLDRVHDYAKTHGIVFKQHNFVWGSQQPAWLAGLSAAQQKAEVEEWIRLFCERYPDVALIDVVNEPPPHTTPAYMDALGGAGSSGYDWIVQAFKWARQYCPHAILILNDYNNIEYANDNTHFIDIVTRIKNAGAPIDAVGAQAHDAYKLGNSTVQGYVAKLATTGLPVYITEYDINLASDSEQQKVMQSQLTLFWNDPNIHGITLWGYIVGATWRADTGLMSSSGSQRPAMMWLMNFLGR
jgi:endo-1,4-beta-xylanase